MAVLPIPPGIATVLFQDIEPLLNRIGVIQGNVGQLLTDQVQNPAATLAGWPDEKRRISDAFEQFETTQREWAGRAVPKAYREALADAEAELQSLSKIVRQPKKIIPEIMNQRSTGVLTRLTESQLQRPYTAAVRAGARDAQKWVRELSQTLVTRDDLDFTMLRGLTSSGGDLRKVVSTLRLDFINQGREGVLNEKFLRVGGRRMRPDAYAELIARTRFHELQSQAALEQAVNFDAPYIKISDHGSDDPACAPFQGKIFSISGNSERYPEMTELPPYHPNCRHTAHPQFVEEAVS